jgi:hypothetical protein
MDVVQRLRRSVEMKYVLALLIVAVEVTAAQARIRCAAAPAPELAAGLPALIGVIGAYAATRLGWKHRT